jgi:starch synthase
LLGSVSRLTPEKVELIAEIGADLVKEDVSLVALGSGDPKYEHFLLELAQAHPTKVAVRIGYDDGLAHRIEAGSDMFLMPSRYEPCGLNQIYSLRYGSIPVVRATGGLDDTIDEDTGFKFQGYTGAVFLSAIREALVEFQSPEKWSARMRIAMAKDFSWSVSAPEYARLYLNLLGS